MVRNFHYKRRTQNDRIQAQERIKFSSLDPSCSRQYTTPLPPPHDWWKLPTTANAARRKETAINKESTEEATITSQRTQRQLPKKVETSKIESQRKFNGTPNAQIEPQASSQHSEPQRSLAHDIQNRTTDGPRRSPTPPMVHGATQYRPTD